MQITMKIQQFFKQYQDAFIHYDINKFSSCYHLPCTLNTPDKIVLLNSMSDCAQEFGAIFIQLKAESTSDIRVKKASFLAVSEQLYLVCIDWYFIDGAGEVFSEFAAIYHVLDNGGILKIVNVVSHELDSSLTLSEPLSW